MSLSRKLLTTGLKNPSLPKHGFTLVELSIVIVIMGLIIGGVTAGMSLVKSSKISSVMNYIQSVQSAIVTFKSVYDALPGDMKNASSYWTGAPNGNGNGNWNSYDMPSNAENFATWYHLSKAGLIPGTYTGVQGAIITAGVNVPKLASGATHSLNVYYGNNWNLYPQQNALNIINANPWTSAILVADAYKIDVKFDDGKPYVGRIITFGGGSLLCFAAHITVNGTTIAARAAKQYDFSVAGGICEMQFAVGSTFWN